MVRLVFALAFALVGLGGCARPPRAPLEGLGPRHPDDSRWLSDEARLAHTLARGCEADDGAACEKLGSLYFVGKGVPRHPFHALALWEYACSRGIAIACEQAAEQLVLGDPLPRDLGHAVELYDAGCGHGRGSACTAVGEMYTSGRSFPPAPRRAARAFKRGCDRGDAAGCHALALATLEGRGVARDAEVGVQLLVAACDDDFGMSCRQLGALHAQGMFVAADAALARSYQRRACTAGDGVSCIELGLRAREEGRRKDALADFTAACEAKDARGCALLGDVYLRLQPIDEPKAAESYARACQGGLWEACGRVAALEHAGGIDATHLRGLYSLACKAGEMPACDYLAGMMLDGVGGPVDLLGAARLYDRACESDIASSCVHLAWMGKNDHGVEPLGWLERACELDAGACVVLGEVHELGLVAGSVVDRAADAYQRGCAADDPDACQRLAGLYARGHGVERDEALAARLFSVACDGERAEACAELGFMHERGIGVRPDDAWARHYRARACKLGFALACEPPPRQAGNPSPPTSVAKP